MAGKVKSYGKIPESISSILENATPFRNSWTPIMDEIVLTAGDDGLLAQIFVAFRKEYGRPANVGSMYARYKKLKTEREE